MPTPCVHRLVLLLGTGAISASSFAQCDPAEIENPYGTETFELVEWRGHYYDAGWFHFRSRPVEGGEWTTPGGSFSGGGGYTLSEPMLEWNDMLVVGGAFHSAGGVSSPNVIGWDGERFQPIGSGLNGEVLAMAVWNGKLVAGGDFTAAGDGFPTLAHVAMFDPESAEWEALGAGLSGFPSGYGSWRIGGLCVHDGDLHATGRFRTSGGATLNGVARYDSASNSWQPLGSGISGMSSGNVGTAITSHDGELWLSGWFQSIGGVSAPYMAIWNGSEWRRAPLGPTRHCLEFHRFQGELYGIGPFPFTLDGVEYDIARYDGESWQPFARVDINWPNTLKTTADGRGLLTCGNFTRINGVLTYGRVRLDCEVDSPCPADLDGDGSVGGADLGLLVAAWGGVGGDVDGDGVTDGADIGLLVASWGACR